MGTTERWSTGRSRSSRRCFPTRWLVRRYFAVAPTVLLVMALAPSGSGSPRPPAGAPEAQIITAAARPESLTFAVLGDVGNGDSVQYDVGRQLWAARGAFPFEFVILLADNRLGRQNSRGL